MAHCLSGDVAARSRFQELFGPLVYRLAEFLGPKGLEGGDFYIYLFEDDRIFRRLSSYRGQASLGPYLRNFVLPSMMRQFVAKDRAAALETASLDSPGAAGDGRALYEVMSKPEPPDNSPARRRLAHIVDSLSDEKRILLKLLYVDDFDLTPAEIQFIVRRTGDSTREIVLKIERARCSVREREAARQAKMEEAESAADWLLAYDRRLARMKSDAPNRASEDATEQRRREQREELEAKRRWREQQRDRAIFEVSRANVTLRYREIAEILSAPVGSVGAQVARLRRELGALRDQIVSEEAAVT